MSGTVLPIKNAVLLTGDAIAAAVYAVSVAQKARARNGLPPSRTLARLAAALSPDGHADALDEPQGHADDMTTHEAAALLGCSERQARRLAPALGGRLAGGRWLLDRRLVIEHKEGTAA